MKYDTLVYIGRFQPVHNAHVEILRRASKLADKVVVIIGSAFQPRTFKNPWTSEEREMMLKAAAKEAGISIIVEHNMDSMYNDQAWVSRVQSLVAKHAEGSVGIIGHKKDDSSFYLDMFPQWAFENVPLIEPLHASSIRDLYFNQDSNLNYFASVLPTAVRDILAFWFNSPEREQLIREKAHIVEYQRQYQHLPYQPIFVTVDSVVICSGHVLLVKRKSEPGKGLWALPGGFFNANDDSIQSAMIRELKEETKIKVPVPVLIGSIKDQKVFDAKNRSARGRTITHAFKIILNDTVPPKVTGSDDAEKAQWVPISEVDSRTCFEDHYDIIMHFVGR